MRDSPTHFGPNLAKARVDRRITQETLAVLTGVPRPTIVRLETGLQPPKWDEVVRFAAALKYPLQYFLTGTRKLPADLPGIAIELYDLGIVDLEIAGAQVPGSFRTREETLAIALRGNNPQPSVIEAVPVILAQRSWRVEVLRAFARCSDLRVWSRIAWLTDVTLALSRRAGFPFKIAALGDLEAIVKNGEPAAEADSLGHPDAKNKSPIWRRWNITYAADVETFLERAQQLAAARQTRLDSAEPD